MTDKSEKVDFIPGCFCDSCIAIAHDRRIRQAVISELLEWCHGQRNIDHDSLDAKLREMERMK